MGLMAKPYKAKVTQEGQGDTSKVMARDGWTAAIAGGSEEVVGEVGITAVATKSSLERRSI